MYKVTEIKINLSEQDLSDFLEDNENYMQQYCETLQAKLQIKYPDAEVDVDVYPNQLTDKLIVDGEVVEFDETDEMEADVHADWDQIASDMVNDWSWLKD